MIVHTGSLPVPPNSGGRRNSGRFVGEPGLADTPPVFGCTMPAESTGMSVPGRAPSVRAVGPTSGAPPASRMLRNRSAGSHGVSPSGSIHRVGLGTYACGSGPPTRPIGSGLR